MIKNNMINIEFDKSNDTIEKIKSAISLNLYIGLSINVEGKFFFEGIEGPEFYSEFIYSFFSDCLTGLPDLSNGKPIKYRATEVPDTFIILEPRNSELSLIFDSKVYRMRREVTVRLKDFAKEIIIASSNFLHYVLTINPELKNERTVKDFEERINFAKNWFYLNFSEKVL